MTAGAGLSTAGVGGTGGAITLTGTLTSVEPVNAQVATTYTVVSGDHTKLVTFSNAAAVAVTLPQATTSLGAGFWVDVANVGSTLVTITPTVSTINGATTLVLARGQGFRIVSDGAQWQIVQGRGIAGATTTVASAQ